MRHQAGGWPPLTLFLSHGYRSREINLHYFGLLSDAGDVQFTVDEGDRPLSMTRLERMVRDADAFVGVFSCPGTADSWPSAAELRAASRYFRLELDLAVRARKPAFVLRDRRYRTVLRAPPGIIQHSYGHQELTGAGPATARQLTAFRSFCERIWASRIFQDLAVPEPEKATVGIILPPAALGYPDDHVVALEELLLRHGLEPLRFAWPPALDLDLLTRIALLDWALLDVADPTGIAAFLHGHFVPMLRLRRVANPGTHPVPESLGEQVLSGGFDVGYVEDLLVWHDLSSLLDGVAARLSLLDAPSRLIATSAEAAAYFSQASQRKERVFLSYSGVNSEQARRLGEVLRQRFGYVFDYRNDRSIPAGTDWQQGIQARLTSSAVGVVLLSDSYVRSPYCVQEARQMIVRANAEKMLIFPIRLDQVEPPPFLRTIQYRDLGNSSFEEIVQEIEDRLGPSTWAS